MEKHDELIAQFCGIADTTEERARFYLESAQWQLPVALSSFYDTGMLPAAANASINEGMDIELQPSDDGESLEEKMPANRFSTRGAAQASNSKFEKVKAKNTKKSNASSRFASIHDFNDGEDNSSEEEGQRFYAGGSEHSGELIVGPPRKKQSNEEITKSLFTEAKKHGAESVEAGSRNSEIHSNPTSRAFSGGGYKLGESVEDSEFVPGGAAAAPEKPPVKVLRLWSNGFTVDDGPLRDFKDPDNQEFLSSIKKGEIPQELVREGRGRAVHMDMEDHRNEEFKPPKKTLKPFSGQGHMLGSPTPEVTMKSNSNESTPGMSSSVDPPVIVDKSLPTTTIQIRLSDGKRLKQQFNQSHRISDIRSYLCNVNPEMSARPFVLMTTFPNKELSDETLTLSDAKLLNSLVVQKLI